MPRADELDVQTTKSQLVAVTKNAELEWVQALVDLGVTELV
jgi:uncharacterized pyridoxal phosphate-containing UPF0001 family protein